MSQAAVPGRRADSTRGTGPASGVDGRRQTAELGESGHGAALGRPRSTVVGEAAQGEISYQRSPGSAAEIATYIQAPHASAIQTNLASLATVTNFATFSMFGADTADGTGFDEMPEQLRSKGVGNRQLRVRTLQGGWRNITFTGIARLQTLLSASTCHKLRV